MEQTSSPGRSPVELRNCIEDLLKFTLDSHLNHSLGFDLGLSKEFCSYLLRPVSGEAVVHPMYKHLASTLCEYITSGGLCGTSKKVSFADDINLEERQNYHELVLTEGTKLLNILKTVNFELHVQEPFFAQMKDGIKTVEGRCATGDYNRIGSGAFLLFNKCLMLQVEDIHWYASFSEMLEVESLAKVLPGVKTIDEGVKVYRRFYTEEKERANGVYAICVAQSANQPYIPLATILYVYSYYRYYLLELGCCYCSFGLKRALNWLIILFWILTALCWLLFGVYFFLGKFSGDMCTASKNFQMNPYNNSLSDILPCDELLEAKPVLIDVSQGIYNIVNQVNENISVVQVCNPFSGPPEYEYQENNCPANTIPIGDIPKILEPLTCTDSNSGTCSNNGQFISINDFRTVENYTNSIQNLLNVYPGMESLVECQSVKDAFFVNPCRPLQATEEVCSDGMGIDAISVIEHGVSGADMDSLGSPRARAPFVGRFC